MATDHQARFQTAEKKILSAFPSVSSLANSSEIMVLSATYLIETAFRFIKLGSRIREEIKKNQMALDAAVKSEGIFRTPIFVTLNNALVQKFFFRSNPNRPCDCELIAPDAFEAMKPERIAFAAGTAEEKSEAFKRLKVARYIILDLSDDNEFTNPLLNEMVGKWIDPGRKNIREMVLELTPILSTEEISMNGLKEMMKAYTSEKLNFHSEVLGELTDRQKGAVNEAINELVWNSFSDDENSADATLEFLVSHRKLKIDEEIEMLREEEEKLAFGDDDEDIVESELRESKAKKIAARIEELEQFKQKLESA